MTIDIFNDPRKVPQPKDQIRIESLVVSPYADRFRIRVEVQTTPFRDRPNLIIVCRDLNDNIIADLSVIESMHSQIDFTMHLRGMDDPAGDYVIEVELFYETRNPPQDRRTVPLSIPPATDHNS